MLAALFAALALASPVPALDPGHLPALPAHGLARQAGPAVVLETLRGRRIGRLDGYDLAIPRARHGLLLANRDGRLFALDPHRHRVRHIVRMPEPTGGCRRVDATMRTSLLLCGRRIELARSWAGATPRKIVVARAADRGGGVWAWAEFAPNGHDVLAEWSGECEIPTAFLIAGGIVRPLGAATYRRAPESEPLGWLSDGRPVVQFRTGVCGSGYAVPGVYTIPRRGPPQLLRRTGTTPVLLSMWGG
jgi:hypothetical protein